jgi:hypothetical protein
MKTLTICAGFAIALLAGCGGQVAPTGGAITGATSAAHGKSWMLPEAKSEDLIYATGGCGGTCVLSYPQGKLVGSLKVGAFAGSGACTDSNGDVFIANNRFVDELAHGGYSPIRTLILPGKYAGECSVDSTTGNLAVIFAGASVGVAIFPPQGTPTTYSTGIDARACGYDNDGDLFVSGYNVQDPGLSELPAGGTQFNVLNISEDVGRPGAIQWDGSYMSYEGTNEGNVTASELSISGSTATIIHVTHFHGIRAYANLSWVNGDSILIPFGRARRKAPFIGAWKYPSGGKPAQVYRNIGKPLGANFQAVTYSPAS